MTPIHYQQAQFVLSAARLSQLPPDKGGEIAFIGRSNSGKSSVLNRVTQIKNLARVSKTPGRTQLINLFAIDKDHRLTDLPGYGYAKVPYEMKQTWKELLDSYLRTRKSLKGLVLVMDIRHPLKDFDQYMISWCCDSQISVHILLNKADKLPRGQMKQTLLVVQKALTSYSMPVSVQLCSAANGTGIDELRAVLDKWYRN